MNYKKHFKNDFGPVLYALGDVSGDAQYRILYYSAAPPICSVNYRPVESKKIFSLDDGTFWVFDFSVPIVDTAQEHKYTVNNKNFSFFVPGKTTENLQIAYASCNGSEAESPQKDPFPGRNALWEHMAKTHKKNAYHILIQGGDQLYADSVWHEIPFLEEWKKLSRTKQYTCPLPHNVYKEIRDYYLACYMAYWSQPHIKNVLANIPSVMIWDDHDIFDGWGSWNKRYQASPVYQGIFKAAQEAFYLFQRGCKVPETEQTAGIMVTLGHTAFIAPDLRTERTRKQVMGTAGWTWLMHALETVGKNKKHLVVISSVPLATSHFSALDPILTGFPSFIAKRLPKKINPKQFADDIHDQWRVPAHRKEWLKILNTFLDFAEQTDTRVTTVSGEIHLGARSTIKRNNVVIHQFIASGISHPPAHPILVWFCEWLSKGVQDISPDIDIQMKYFFPTGRKKYLRARNWLSLSLTEKSKISACWYAENHAPFIFED